MHTTKTQSCSGRRNATDDSETCGVLNLQRWTRWLGPGWLGFVDAMPGWLRTFFLAAAEPRKLLPQGNFSIAINSHFPPMLSAFLFPPGNFQKNLFLEDIIILVLLLQQQHYILGTLVVTHKLKGSGSYCAKGKQR